jgi:hypothetical protein
VVVVVVTRVGTTGGMSGGTIAETADGTTVETTGRIRGTRGGMTATRAGTTDGMSGGTSGKIRGTSGGMIDAMHHGRHQDECSQRWGVGMSGKPLSSQAGPTSQEAIQKNHLLSMNLWTESLWNL